MNTVLSSTCKTNLRTRAEGCTYHFAQPGHPRKIPASQVVVEDECSIKLWESFNQSWWVYSDVLCTWTRHKLTDLARTNSPFDACPPLEKRPTRQHRCWIFRYLETVKNKKQKWWEWLAKQLARIGHASEASWSAKKPRQTKRWPPTMLLMSVTRETSHAERSWLKESASLNWDHITNIAREQNEVRRNRAWLL